MEIVTGEFLRVFVDYIKHGGITREVIYGIHYFRTNKQTVNHDNYVNILEEKCVHPARPQLDMVINLRPSPNTLR